MSASTVFITVAGGVAYVSQNDDNVTVSIIDYDNLTEIVAEAPTASDREPISVADASYLMNKDANFWNQIKEYVVVASD